MARSNSPAYQRYPRDILANPDIAVLSLEEYGAYERLRDYIWLEGFLINDERYLAKILKISPKKFRSLFSAIKKLFQIEDGKITCPELDGERLKQEEHRVLRAKAGRKSGEVRRQQMLNTCSHSVEHVLNSSTSTSTSKNPLPPSGGNGVVVVEEKQENRFSSGKVSKFTEAERRKYALSQQGIKFPDAWLKKSEDGSFDSSIEKWRNDQKGVGFNGATSTACPRCKWYLDDPEHIRPCFAHQQRQFDDWKLRRESKTEPSE